MARVDRTDGSYSIEDWMAAVIDFLADFSARPRFSTDICIFSRVSISRATLHADADIEFILI